MADRRSGHARVRESEQGEKEREENRGATDTARKKRGEGMLEEGEISIGLERLQLYEI